jgi:hypothetical protein
LGREQFLRLALTHLNLGTLQRFGLK